MPFKQWVGRNPELRQPHLANRLPPICVACFKQMCVHAGIDPRKVQVSYAPWREQLKTWEAAQKEPAHRGRIFMDDMIVWCDVLQELGNHRYEIQLDDSGDTEEATWDGSTYERSTGRPLLLPIAENSSLTDELGRASPMDDLPANWSPSRTRRIKQPRVCRCLKFASSRIAS